LDARTPNRTSPQFAGRPQLWCRRRVHAILQRTTLRRRLKSTSLRSAPSHSHFETDHVRFQPNKKQAWRLDRLERNLIRISVIMFIVGSRRRVLADLRRVPITYFGFAGRSINSPTYFLIANVLIGPCGFGDG
jgi:hypothetical protein